MQRRALTLGLAAGAACAGLPAAAQGAPLQRRLAPLLRGPQALAGIAAAVWRGGQAPQLALLGQAGQDQPVRSDTLWRVASISKLAQALVALRLHERGLLDLDAPLSALLGFDLRHPDGHRPSGRELLCHHGGLRDNGDDGLHLPREPLSPALIAPLWGARRFSYANFNSVVLGTAMEAASGQRYDDLLQAELFGPLGIEAAFDPSRLSAAQQARVATLQRRLDGSLRNQTADLRREPPAPRLPPDYRPGRNCAALAPQGGLHTSLAGLMRLAEALRRGDPSLLTPAGHEALAQRQGSADERGLFRAWGSGAQLFTDTPGGDRLHPRGGWRGLGHLAEAYGLLGGLIVQPARAADPGWGLVFLLHGTPPEPPAGRYSAFSASEEAILSALLDTLTS